MASACKKCGDEVVWVLTPGRTKDYWTPYDPPPDRDGFRFNEKGEVTGVSLRRHFCGEARAPAPATPAPPAVTPPPDMERAQGQRAASAAQIDAVPAEPEGFFDDPLPF